MENLCYIQPVDLEAKLGEMGLSAPIIQQAVIAGQLRRNSCTRNDPPSIPGMEAWRWTVRTLRELLIPLGWERSDAGNFSLVVNYKMGIAIAVNTGDDGTGDPLCIPRTKHPKGSKTAAAILKNAEQLSFKFPGEEETDNIANAKLLTWVLLVAREHDRVLYELCLPISMKDGKPVGWKERIIFPPLDLAPRVQETINAAEQIVVKISKKG
jgi:hypothetical protein